MKHLLAVPLSLLPLHAFAFQTFSEATRFSHSDGIATLLILASGAICFIGIPCLLYLVINHYLEERFPKLSEGQAVWLTLAIIGVFTCLTAEWLFPLVDQLAGIMPIILLVGGVWWLFKSK